MRIYMTNTFYIYLYSFTKSCNSNELMWTWGYFANKSNTKNETNSPMASNKCAKDKSKTSSKSIKALDDKRAKGN